MLACFYLKLILMLFLVLFGNNGNYMNSALKFKGIPGSLCDMNNGQ